MFYIPNKSGLKTEGYADLRLAEIIRGIPAGLAMWGGLPNIWRPYKYKIGFYGISYEIVDDV